MSQFTKHLILSILTLTMFGCLFIIVISDCEITKLEYDNIKDVSGSKEFNEMLFIYRKDKKISKKIH